MKLSLAIHPHHYHVSLHRSRCCLQTQNVRCILFVLGLFWGFFGGGEAREELLHKQVIYRSLHLIRQLTDDGLWERESGSEIY